jgi:WD40 repeat protein
VSASQKITACAWVDKQQFVVAANSEVTLWNITKENPVSLLDTGKSLQVFDLHSKLSSKGRFSITACSQQQVSVFKLNSNGIKKSTQATSKVLIEKQDGYLSAKVNSNTQI